jgi:Putative Flp pilus-assembly TadE/G-like
MRFFGDERGSVAVYVAMIGLTAIGAGAAAIDVGRGVILRTQMQNAADARAMAAAAQLDGRDGARARAKTVAKDIMDSQTAIAADSDEIKAKDPIFYSQYTPTKVLATSDQDAAIVEVTLEARRVDYLHGPILQTTIAQEKSKAELEAADDLSHEYTICSMYYLIRSQCLASRGDAGSLMLAARSIEALDAAAEYSLSFGKQAGLLPEAIIVRQKLAYQEQSGKLNNCSKISGLALEYADSCQVIMQNPGDAFYKELQRQQAWD